MHVIGPFGGTLHGRGWHTRRSLRPQRRCQCHDTSPESPRRSPETLGMACGLGSVLLGVGLVSLGGCCTTLLYLMITYGPPPARRARRAQCWQNANPNRIASCKLWIFAYPVNQRKDVTVPGTHPYLHTCPPPVCVHAGTHAAVSRPPNAVSTSSQGAGKRSEEACRLYAALALPPGVLVVVQQSAGGRPPPCRAFRPYIHTSHIMRVVRHVYGEPEPHMMMHSSSRTRRAAPDVTVAPSSPSPPCSNPVLFCPLISTCDAQRTAILFFCLLLSSSPHSTGVEARCVSHYSYSGRPRGHGTSCPLRVTIVHEVRPCDVDVEPKRKAR